MQAQSFLLPRPSFDLAPATRADFEHLFQSTPTGSLVDYRLPYPKWQYLSYLCDTKDLVLHGSQNVHIVQVEPRHARDTKAFSNQEAIYATTDGIWVIFYAILDRQKYPQMTLFNSCLRARVPAGVFGEPMYFFSITHEVLLQKPWCEGMVYIVPRRSFVQEAPQQVHGLEIVFPHWISSVPVSPVARLRAGPEDFPSLAQVHGHDNEKLVQLSTADPGGFPWPQALVS
jgi:hypothetical protein